MQAGISIETESSTQHLQLLWAMAHQMNNMQHLYNNGRYVMEVVSIERFSGP